MMKEKCQMQNNLKNVWLGCHLWVKMTTIQIEYIMINKGIRVLQDLAMISFCTKHRAVLNQFYIVKFFFIFFYL